VSFEQNLKAENLPIHLNDEIGLLARSFSSMADTIKSNFAKLELARQEAVHANEQKEEFLQNMSHEIRNPLHTIIGMCRVLSDNNPRKDQLSLIDSLKFSSEHLLALVNDVLDFAKLKEGRISLVCEPVAVSTLLNQIMKSYLYESKTRKLDFDLEMDPGLQNQVVLTDPVRINQILHNLLSNAFKFTREGGKVRLVVRLAEKSEKQVKIHFEVRDTGIGIESENLDLIRQRFAKVDRSDSPVSNIQGAGLGLPIVIQLLDLFNSSLEISSQSGQGSVFSFDLSLERTTEDLDAKSVSLEQSRERFQGLDVLIVDDDPQILDLYRHVLTDRLSNFETLSHPSRLAVELAGRKFDLIITDFNFDEEQITAYSELLNQRLKTGARLVCITGAHDVAVIRANELLKIDEVWQKPVKPERLLELLRAMTREGSLPLPDFSALYEDYDQDRSKVSNALGIMLDEWQAAVTGFELAIQEKNAVKMKAVLHRLANTFRRIKLDYLEKDLEQLTSSDPFGADEVNSTWAGIKSKMLFYLDCIRQELENCNSL
jgi:signal transduction histidine kinase/DNA-binding response OmpR family regulator